MNWETENVIRLSKEESVEFIRAIFKPTRKEIERVREILDKIDKNIIIKKTSNGFEADISDLDLSVLRIKA